MDFDDFKLVYAYTRTQAIADGVLIPISEKEHGLKIPAVVSSNLYHPYIEPPEKIVGEGRSASVLRTTERRFLGGHVYWLCRSLGPGQRGTPSGLEQF